MNQNTTPETPEEDITARCLRRDPNWDLPWAEQQFDGSAWLFSVISVVAYLIAAVALVKVFFDALS